MKNLLLFLFVCILPLASFSQQIKIGDWGMHLNYTNINAIVVKNERIYVGTESGLFLYDENDNSLTAFSKLDGLSSLNITALDYDNGVLMIGYVDGNIDILQNNRVFSIPHIELANILGSKKINDIFIQNNLAYVSCPFGLVIVNISEREIKETCYLSDDGATTEVFASHVFDETINSDVDHFLANKVFLATNRGLFYADKYDNLLDYSVWGRDSRISLLQNSNKYIYPTENIEIVSLFGFDKKESGGKGLIIGTNLDYSTIQSPWLESSKYNFFELNAIAYGDPSSVDLNLFVVNSGVRGEIVDFQYNSVAEKTIIIVNDNYIQKAIVLNEFFQNILSVNSNEIIESVENINLTSAAVSSDYNNSSKLFLADGKFGLIMGENSGFDIEFLEIIAPNGPVGINIGEIASGGNSIMLTHGGKTQPWNNLENYQEVSFFNNSAWSCSNKLIELNIYDALAVSSGFNENQFFVGTWNNGLLEFFKDSLVNHYTSENTNGQIETITGTDISRVGGVDLDNNNVLWLTNSQAEKPLVKFDNVSWKSFSVPNLPTNVMSGEIMCASNGQKWIQLRNDGILVVQENKDGVESKKLGTQNGLPSNTINCFIEDADGSIWVGTSQGLSVFYFPSEIFNNSSYGAEYILIETDDGYVEKLFENTEILDIKVDGGNRKWIGTKTNGVFLISEDGTSQTYNFTKENSPLLDNSVYEISVIESSGEVFFATARGVCSYRSNATVSKNNFNNVLIFPNPVKRDYTGEIAISGLSDNTNVKITDISGNFVFETMSFGGTAMWNGKTMDGKRVATGVYLFLCTSADFEKSVVKKVLIYN